MQLTFISEMFSVCKVTDYSQVNWEQPYLFIGQTDQEKSLVCLTEYVPANATEREDGWIAFRVEGELDFSLIGILSRLSGLLADEGISIFALSTFKTDYILIKSDEAEKAQKVLKEAGYNLV
ncbi:ACT domain-containing protein [Streptococcus sp. H49]|uniref:ACT domain-containing protein n=1 Tax=Streptococcus huangxiaojuni TaxID=3237239 RepID=UPI0034A17C6A